MTESFFAIIRRIMITSHLSEICSITFLIIMHIEVPIVFEQLLTEFLLMIIENKRFLKN